MESDIPRNAFDLIVVGPFLLVNLRDEVPEDSTEVLDFIHKLQHVDVPSPLSPLNTVPTEF